MRVGHRAAVLRVERRWVAAILPIESIQPLPMLNRQVEHAVELLCHRGCRAVWGVIRALERGEALPETAGLDEREIQAVVGELRAIMSVYADSCRVPD